MADTLVEVFKDTFDVTDFPTAGTSVTLVTTDASTTYVIKDIDALSTLASYDYTLSVNGVSIGSNSTSVAGSLIVPVSTAVTMTTTTLPAATMFLRSTSMNETSPYPIEEFNRFTANDGAVTGTDSGTATLYASPPASMSFGGNREFIYSSGSAFYQYYDDNNSSNTMYYWATGGAARTTLATMGYDKGAWSPDEEAMYYVVSDSLKKHTVAAGAVTVASIPSAAHAFSTYSRSAYCNGYFFWMISNAQTTGCYAICLATGVNFEFQSMTTNASYSSYTYLWASYDSDTDKFHIYRNESVGTDADIYCAVLAETVTAMTAETTNQTVTAYASDTTIVYPNTTSTPLNFDAAGENNVQGSPSDGDVFYYNTSQSPYQALYSYNFATQTETSLGVSLNKTRTSLSQGFNFFTPTAAQITAQSLPASSITLRATGVKTV